MAAAIQIQATKEQFSQTEKKLKEDAANKLEQITKDLSAKLQAKDNELKQVCITLLLSSVFFFYYLRQKNPFSKRQRGKLIIPKKRQWTAEKKLN